MLNIFNGYIHKKWTFLIVLEAVRNAHVPISHVHMQYGRLLTYYWYILKLLTFQGRQ